MMFLLFFGVTIVLGLALCFVGLIAAFVYAVFYHTIRDLHDKFQRKTGRRGSETLDFADYPGPVRHQ